MEFSLIVSLSSSFGLVKCSSVNVFSVKVIGKRSASKWIPWIYLE